MIVETPQALPRRLSRQKIVQYAVLVAVLTYSALVPGASLMSEWESFTVYGTFGGQGTGLSLQIAPMANIYHQGYALLEASRPLLRVLGLSPSLEHLRLPVIMCGVVTLVLVFVITRRWFSAWPALIAVALLAANPIFSQYQHELIITGPSLMVFCLFVERLQYLTRHLRSMLAWATLSVAFALVMMLYGPGRIATVVILIGWVVVMLLAQGRLDSGKSRFFLVVNTSLMTLGAGLLLVLIDTRNRDLLGLRILFPPESESVFTNSHSPITILQTVGINSRILAESLILGGGSYHSSYLEGTLVQGRYPMLPLVVVPIVLGGIFVALNQWGRVGWLRPSRWNATLLIFAITTAPLVFSSTFMLPDPDHVGQRYLGASLVNYRLTFMLLPAALCVSAFAWWLLAVRPRIRVVGIGILLAAIGWTAIVLPISRQHFSQRLDAADARLFGPEARAQWLDGYSTLDRSPAWTSHLTQHNQYRSWAAAESVAMGATPPPQCPNIVFAPLTQFTEAALAPFSLGDLPSRNYHSVFLASYLASTRSDLKPAFVFVPPADLQLESIGGKVALWSANLHELPDGGFDYIDADMANASIVTPSSGTPNVVIATTATELEFARNAFQCHSDPGDTSKVAQ